MVVNATSTSDTVASEAGRPRRRRALGVVAAAAICAAPLGFAPAASAQTGSNPLGGLGETLGNTVQALPTTLGDPLGGPADESRRADACTDLGGIGPFLTCLIDRLDGGQSAQAKIKARVRTKMRRSTSKVRWALR
jgi:hypothetical protein